MVKHIFYDIHGNEIKVAVCESCGHEVDITKIRNLKINGIEEIETTPLALIDAIMKDAIHPCCNDPDYMFK